MEAQVAAGGMGVVYRARDTETGAPVALKLLAARDPDNQERFAREATILAQLDHPAIVRYVAHGATAEGVPYIAMDWAHGETLFQRLASAGVSLAETVALGQRVADALGYAHARGVVHRDVKPSNLVLLGATVADVAILDFGIARAEAVPSSLTETGAVLGTPSYMSPEQARGERAVDARADVFSLGCVLYECATGQLAFEGRHVLALVAKIVFWEPPRLRRVVPDAPKALDDLFVRMLAKDPARRPRDGAEVAAELARIHIAAAPPRKPPVSRDAPTLVGATPAPRPDRLVCVVAATPADGESAPLAPAALDARRAALRTRMETYRVHCEVLLDGSVMVIAAGGAPDAVVQRALACAREIRALAPDLLVAVKSGPLDGDDAVAAAAQGLLDATVAALAKEAMAALFGGISGAARPRGAIRLDDATARLCPQDTIVRANGVAYLASP